MEPGNIVEFIDSQKIICAVILEIKKQRLKLLTENNREVTLSPTRLTFTCSDRLNLTWNRAKLVESLKETASKRKNLIPAIDIREIWEVLNTEEEWIDLETMTLFCFQNPVTPDHTSAVIRAFFQDRTYFKFNHDKFLPFSEQQVESIIAQEKETERINQLIKKGGNWLKGIIKNAAPPVMTDQDRAYAEILKSCFIFGKDSPQYPIGKEILSQANLDMGSRLFHILVQAGTLDRHENIELLRNDIPVIFPDAIEEAAQKIKQGTAASADKNRKDLTDLTIFTIDGQSTLDFDDALSIERDADSYRIGVHISDVGHVVRKGDIIDTEALKRGTSIYMPDLKIPMLHPLLSEETCSLKAGSERPAISILVRMTKFAEVIDYEILPSIINISRQLSYAEANRIAETDEGIKILYQLAGYFREKRLKAGAIQINLPEINVFLNDNKEIDLIRTDRETPGRMLVAEMMILANHLMAGFIADHKLPAIFRSQPAPKNRILKNDGETTLFENCLQRKFLSRLVIGTVPEHHSGLGLSGYVTATSPIRKYFDLVTQRQVRAILGLEDPYSEQEIRQIIQELESPMRNAGHVQFMRHRFWILAMLEKRIGEKEEALVMDRRRNEYIIILTKYMLECPMAQSSGTSLKPGDLIQVIIQHADARNDNLAVFMG
ncbi:MAG: RNB domain-containing ribonuclease [Desulfobacteraceae bacterium]|nr:MAG: RNB domain-containing ribonuclease [Desulfobacteraceae bacterium]